MKISITITEATPEEATKIVAAFSGGHSQNVKVVEVAKDAQPVKEDVKPAVAQPIKTSNGATGKLTAVAPAATKPAATNNAVSSQPRVAMANPAKPAVKTAAKQPEPEVEEEEEAEEEETEEATADVEVSDELLAEMKKATKIKDVLNPLIQLGLNTAEALVAKCEELKPDVPVLSRIPDLADRVNRAAEVLLQD